ncbi:MAG: type II toxin-antitoxin system VapC family toxin [Verrucomicrobiaceae bacterium]|nr:type II toxin-antitoxin system VapC family toxin [Verrucomicrobiaceae bacterium]
MKPFADASFIVSFCAEDQHSTKARQWWKQHSRPMFTSRLALFEAENTIRVMRVARKLTAAGELHALESLKRAQLEGFIELWEVPVRRLYPAARRLSQHHNNQKGFGAMDILHVASALDMHCDTLLSFDEPQRDLAKAEGLKVAP